MNTSKLLVEEPVIKLSDEDRNNPDAIDFKDKVKQAVAKEEEEKAAAELEQKRADLKVKYAHVIDLINSDKDIESKIDDVFDELVPPSGAADTAAGELVRAIVRILFRWYNDGDYLFTGYGLETCGSSAEYLFDNGFNHQVAKILDEAPYLYDNDEKYKEALLNLAKDVLTHIVNNPELLAEPNNDDSRDYSSEYIEENSLTFESSISASYEVEQLVDAGIINAWDLNNYVENEMEYHSECKDAIVERPWSRTSTEVTITNLSEDGLHLVEEWGNNLESFWQELVDEHADELQDEDDSDYDDEYDAE